MSDTKNSQQAGRYDMLQNAAGEILIIIEYREGGPENPRLVYDGGEQAALARYLILNKESDKISKDYFRTVVNRNYKDKYVQLAAERYRFNI